MIEYLDEVLWPIVLTLPIMYGYVKTFKNKDGYKDKNKNKNWCLSI